MVNCPSQKRQVKVVQGDATCGDDNGCVAKVQPVFICSVWLPELVMISLRPVWRATTVTEMSIVTEVSAMTFLSKRS